MFNIFFNDHFLIRLDCKLSAYADDTQLFCTGTDFASVYQGMNADLIAVSGWFSCNGLAVNSDKCLSMWLGNTTANPSYHLDSYAISSVDTIKLLAVTIDRQLNSGAAERYFEWGGLTGGYTMTPWTN